MAGAELRGPPNVKCPCSPAIGRWEPGGSGIRKKQTMTLRLTLWLRFLHRSREKAQPTTDTAFRSDFSLPLSCLKVRPASPWRNAPSFRHLFNQPRPLAMELSRSCLCKQCRAGHLCG